MDEAYEVLELIGEGSFGRVFKGRDKRSNQTVALKLIPKVNKNPAEIASLRNEFNIQKKLDHPNVVKILDALETTNEIIVVAEFVPGELHKLFDLYKGSQPGVSRSLPEARVREIAIDLLNALFYLHKNRILHRDIKPQNVLVDSNGRVKLCDFGFARNLSMNTHVLTSIKGTPLYMAPELIEEKPYDHAADIWSVGCILYELLVGFPPFSTKNIIQLINKVRYDAIQWPSHISDVCLDFLQGVLDKDSRRRLSWPKLLKHPFVAEYFDRYPPESSALPKDAISLTQPLSESEELAKEIQRQSKAKLLTGNSQTLLKIAYKYDQARQRIANQALLNHHSSAHARRSSFPAAPPSVVLPQLGFKGQQRRHSDFTQPITTSNFPPSTGPPLLQGPEVRKPSDVEIPTDPQANNSNEMVKTSVHVQEYQFEIDEWCEFLDEQIGEAMNDLEVLNNQNFVVMVTSPLKTQLLDKEVLKRVLTLLVTPWLGQNKQDEGLRSSVLSGYISIELINSVTSCLWTIMSSESQLEEVSYLMVTIITRLIYSNEEIAKQFNETPFTLNVIRLLLQNEGRKRFWQSEALTWGIRLLHIGCCSTQIRATFLHCLATQNGLSDVPVFREKMLLIAKLSSIGDSS